MRALLVNAMRSAVAVTGCERAVAILVCGSGSEIVECTGCDDAAVDRAALRALFPSSADAPFAVDPGRCSTLFAAHGDEAPVAAAFAVPIAVAERRGGLVLPGNRAREGLQPSESIALQAIAQNVGLGIARLDDGVRLEEAQKRFADFAAISRGWLWETDAGHRFTAFGYGHDRQQVQRPDADFIGRTRWEVSGARPDDPIWAAHKADMDNRRPFHAFEYPVADSDGTIHYISISGQPRFAADGTFLGYRGVALDITDRKTAELKLKESEEGLRYLFARNPNAMWIYDRFTLRFLAVNDAAIMRYGWSRDEFLSMSILDIRPPEDMEKAKTAATERNSAYRFGGGWRHRTRDGRELAVEIESFALDYEGRAAVLAAARDVTERIKAEQQLRDREQEFRYLFEKNPNPMWIYDRDDLRFLSVNEAAVVHYGWSRDEFLSMSILDIRPEEERERLVTFIRGLQGDLFRGGAWIHNTKAGDTRFVEVDGAGILFGRHRAMLNVIRDVTEQKRAELALHEAEEKLRQAQKLEAVGQLTGGISHDFNNLLTVILGNVDILQQDPDTSDSIKPLLATLRMAAERGADLTHRLLAFARRQALDPREVNANELVSRMHSLIGRTLGEDIEITLVLDPDVPPALVDPAQLETAILNLAINARDAMADGGKLVIETSSVSLDAEYCRLNPETTPGDYVCVGVSDTGCGMSADVAARAFEPFFTTKEVGKGSGLGLSMVYGFARQTGGSAKIYSEPGQGTIVRLYLPRASGAEVHSDDHNRDTSDAAETGQTVLVVEDDALVRRTAMEHLLALGYQVVGAASAAEALPILRARDQIALLFTDIVMPGGMNGKELAAAALLIRPNLKVLFTSGYSENTIVHQGRLDPGINLLSKPYRRRDLASKVAEVLSGETTPRHRHNGGMGG